MSEAKANEGASTSKISLNDICYEQIKDNFYYGKFGEFRLVIDKNTGCFNATKLCKVGNKDFFDWSRLKRSKALIQYYEDKSCPADLRGNFYEIRESNNSVNKLITGQYVQKELILDIASWISIEFYDKCSKIVNYFFIELYKKDLELKEQELQKMKEQFKLEREENKEALQEAYEKVDEYKEMALNFQQLAISDIHLEQTQVIYISTSPNYAKQNRFKVGGVQAKKFLKSRLSTYNSRSAVGDFFYYSDIFTVIEYRQIEERLKCLLKRFRDKQSKEMYVMYYPDLKYIVNYLCEHLSDEVDEVNRKLSEFIFNYVKRGRQAVIPVVNQEWENEEQEDVEDNEDNEQEKLASEIVKLREALTDLLIKLPSTQTEITKKELFDKLKVRTNRTEKLVHVKEVIAEVRPSLVLRERKERKAKECVGKYPK